MLIQHVYQTSGYKTITIPTGFADFVIGTMSLFCFNDGEIEVNYENHPISLFLENCYYNKTKKTLDDNEILELFHSSKNDIFNIIKSLNTFTKIATNTRGYILSEKLKKFIINTFKPNKQFQEYIDFKIKELNLFDFDTVHIRLGDYNMQTSVDNLKKTFKNIFLKEYSNKNIFLMSDNKYIKKFLCEEFPNLKIIESDPIHLGDLSNSKNLELDVKNTLLDFYIMSKTKNAYCYSVYGGSGFSQVCSEIFDFTYELKQIC